MKSLRNSFLHQLDQCCHNLLRIVPLDKMEILAWVCFLQLRHLPSADAMRRCDDPAVRRLPEHFSEADDRHYTTFDQVPKHRPRPNRGKLVHVADQNESAGVGKTRARE